MKDFDVIPFSKELMDRLGYNAENPLYLPNENILSMKRVVRVTDGANTPFEVVVALPTLNGIRKIKFNSVWCKKDREIGEVVTCDLQWCWSQGDEMHEPGMAAFLVKRRLEDCGFEPNDD